MNLYGRIMTFILMSINNKQGDRRNTKKKIKLK